MDIIDSLKSKYKLTSETEHFLLSRTDCQDNGHENKDKEDTQVNCNDKISADFDGSVKRFYVPSAAVPNGVAIDVIKPKDAARRPGILVNFHGDGLVMGSYQSSEAMCKLLARDLKCVVVNVEYREAPSHKFPAMFDDAKAVVRWILMNKSLIGGENDSKIGVIGSSVGGGIAATCAFEVPGIDYQILAYPLVDWRCQDPSYEEFKFPGCNFNFSDISKRVVDTSITCEADKTSPRASPVLQNDFSHLPPTLLFIAEIDHLKHSNYEFKSKLKAAQVICESKLMRGIVHGFFSLPGPFKEVNQRAREIIGQFYKKHGVS